MLKADRRGVSPSLPKELMDEGSILDLSALCTKLTLNPVKSFKSYFPLFFFFFKDFIYLFMIVTERERGRATGRGRSRLHAAS